MWEAYFADRSDGNRRVIFDHYVQKQLVEKVAGKVFRKIPPSAMTTREDLIAAGLWAMWRSIDRYEPDKGTKFTTFAGSRIMGACLDHVRSSDWISRRGRESQKVGAEVPEMCSLEQLAGFQDGGIVDDASTEKREQLARVMRSLNHLQRKVIKILYLDLETIDVASKRLGQTTGAVAKIRDTAIARMRDSVQGTSRVCQQSQV